LQRLHLLLLFLCFSLLLGGCSDSSNSGGSSTPAISSTPTVSSTPVASSNPESSQTHTITVTLPSTYLYSINQSVALPAGKSCVITTTGYGQHIRKFQQLTFATTGSSITINIPDLKGATSLTFMIQISLDSLFHDKATWDNASKVNLVAAGAFRDTGNGTKNYYFDSNITSVEFTILAKQNN
jgi:hypothetical protein